MDRRGQDLASRMRAALDADRAARESAEADRDRRLTEARAAREALLSDLEGFASVVGDVSAARDAEGLLLRRGERWIRFEPQGDGDRVRVAFPGAEAAEHRLWREPLLRDKWVWSFRRHGREERLPLFDSGLEELMVRALDLPRVTSDEAPGRVAPAPPVSAVAPSAGEEVAPGDAADRPRKRDL